MVKEEISASMNVLKNQILELLIKAYNYAAKGMEKEEEVTILAAQVGENDPKFLKQLNETKKYLVAAKITIKQKAGPLLSEIVGHENKAHAADLEMLRNKIHTMCMNIFEDEPEHRKFIIKAKNQSKKDALAFIVKLKQELS